MTFATEKELCAAFFAALADRQRLGELHNQLHPVVNRRVRAMLASWKNLFTASPALTPEDVVQEVHLRLFQHPPQLDGRHPPHVTLAAWIRITTVNFLRDQYRKLHGRGLVAKVRVSQDDLTAMPSVEWGQPAKLVSRSMSQQVESKLMFERFLAFLQQEYPAGAHYLRMREKAPHCDGYELAELLGVSRANLDQMAHRTRLMAVRFHRSWSSEVSQDVD